MTLPNSFYKSCLRAAVSSLLLLLTLATRGQSPARHIAISPDLELERLTEQVYLHRSFLNSEQFGWVACNGMIYINSGKALVFDTPTTPELTAQLFDWLEDSLEVSIQGLIVNHFHDDCLGGLAEVHRRNIPSIAHRKTQKLAKKAGVVVPEIGFVKTLDMQVGGRPVVCRHLGEAHTRDNIVVWLPVEKVLFGGCMVKSLDAGKGNLADANVAAWPATIEAIQAAFPEVQIVIPGHGAPGGPDLLDYTIRLFREIP